MVHRERTRLLFASAVIGVAAIIGSVFAGLPAAADPPHDTAASAYAVNVPSSVLAAAASGAVTATGGALSDGDVGGLLANTTKYDAAWRALVAAYGPDLAGATGADAAEIATLTAEAATPATELAIISKLDVPYAATAIGFTLGPKFDSAVGIDDAPGLCEGGSADAWGSIIAQLSDVDCPQWKLTQAFENQANIDADPVVVGGKTCSLSMPTDCATVIGTVSAGYACVHLEGPGTVWIWRSANSTITYHDPTAGGTGLVAGTGTGCAAVGDDGSGNFELNTFNLAQIKSYCVGDGDGTFVDNCGLAVPEVVTTIPGDPRRKFTCKVTMTDGSTFEADSTTFYESDSSIPRPVVPAVPPGKIPETITCSEFGGPSPIVAVSPTPTTTSYQNWARQYPKCVNGSCLVDLKRNGVSCLFQEIDCDGWVTDPDLAVDYKCFIGPYEVADSECFIYGTTFNETDRKNGFGYANPATGSKTDQPTTQSEVDRLAASYLKDDWVTIPEFAPLTAEEKWKAARQVAISCLTYAVIPFQGVQQVGELPVIQLNAPDCDKRSIFAPGIDVKEATVHDGEAILAGQASVLHFESNADKNSGDNALPRTWYTRVIYNDCGANYIQGVTNCDEYPYYSSMEGGPGASLKNINAADNQREGRLLQDFYSACGVTSTFPEYATLPSLADTEDIEAAPGIPSVGICIAP